jgi:hypothetical protein
MDLQGIRDALQKQPFKPFSISLADGRSFFVPHPELVAVGKRRVIVFDKYDSWWEIEPLLIVSLDFNGNRHTKRHKNSRN